MNKLNPKSGQVMIVTIIFLAVVMIISATLFGNVAHFVQFGARSTLKEQAVNVAEAGLNDALWELTQNSSYGGESDKPVGTTGTFSTQITDKDDNVKAITVTGFVPDSANPRSKVTIKADSTLSGLGFPVAFHQVVLNNDYIYSIGGRQCADGSVQYTKVNSDGLLSPWAETTELPEGKYFSHSAVLNNYVYIIAGSGESCQSTDTVYFNQFNADGTLGDWSEATSFPEVMSNGSAAATTVNGNSYIYVVGGNTTSPGELTTIYYAQQNESDGTLGPWTLNPYPLPYGFTALSAEIHNGFLYIIGGDVFCGTPHYNCGATDAIYYAPVNSDATVGTPEGEHFLVNPEFLPEHLILHSTVIANDYLYVVGGRLRVGGNSESLDTVYIGQFNPDGTISSFSTSINPIPEPRDSTGVVFTHGNLYVVGGYSAAQNSMHSEVWSAPITGPGGEIGEWIDNPGPAQSWTVKKGTYRFTSDP